MQATIVTPEITFCVNVPCVTQAYEMLEKVQELLTFPSLFCQEHNLPTLQSETLVVLHEQREPSYWFYLGSEFGFDRSNRLYFHHIQKEWRKNSP